MRRWSSSTAPAACSGSVTAASPCSSDGPDGGDEALPQAAAAHRRGVARLLGSARPPPALLPALPRLRHQALLPACALPRLPLLGDRVGAGERARRGLQLHRDLSEPGARLPRGAALRARDRRAGRGRAHDVERRRLRAGRGARRHGGRGGVRGRDGGDHAREVPARVMILDLHLHSELSDDSRAPVEAYLKLLQRKRDERPLDGIVLTEHRQFDPTRDYRALEDRYGFLILTAAEVETDYGHVLVYGVDEDILARFDFRNVRLPAQELVTGVDRLGGIALPCHPGRATVGLCAHYETKPPLEGVVAVEAINGGSRKGEDERVEELIRRYGYRAYGGSDSHLVSFVGICATEFEAPIRTIDDLVRELKGGRYRPVDFRPRRAVAG